MRKCLGISACLMIALAAFMFGGRGSAYWCPLDARQQAAVVAGEDCWVSFRHPCPPDEANICTSCTNEGSEWICDQRGQTFKTQQVPDYSDVRAWEEGDFMGRTLYEVSAVTWACMTKHECAQYCMYWGWDPEHQKDIYVCYSFEAGDDVPYDPKWLKTDYPSLLCPRS